MLEEQQCPAKNLHTNYSSRYQRISEKPRRITFDNFFSWKNYKINLKFLPIIIK
jgi:hypothetical protein